MGNMTLTRKRGVLDSSRVLFLPVRDIRPNPNQPRTTFSLKGLEELSASIREHGILQPLTVRRAEDKGYELISGERRLRAAKMAGLDTVPCILTRADDMESSLLAIIENLQRRDLDPFEEAEGLLRLTRDFGLTQTSVYIAKELGEKVSQNNEMPVSVVLLPPLNTSNAAEPKLQISATDIDFTDFGSKSKKTAEITLLNVGQAPLTISSLQMFTSGLKVTLGNRDIAPGQSTVLKVTGFAEELQKLRARPRILMITNDPTNPKIVINIKK